MAKKAKEVALPTRENLEALAGEVNTVLNCDPPIKFTKKTTDAELVEMIKTEVKDGVYEIDFTEDENDKSIPVFSEESRADFVAIGIEVLPGSPDGDEEEAESHGIDMDDGKEIQDELPLEDEVEPEPVATKAKGKKPALVVIEDRRHTPEVPVKAPEKPVKGKTEAVKATTKATPQKAVKTASNCPTKNGVRYTRSNALVEALEKGGTKQELVNAADELFQKYGGNSNTTVMELQYRFSMPCLFELEVVEKDKTGRIAYTK